MKIRINEVVKAAEPGNRKLVRTIMRSMKKLKRVGTYSEYAPKLDFKVSYNRTLVGEALWDIWTYCSDQDLPWLNLLVVRQDTRLPGDGVRKWYKGKYGKLVGCDGFCYMHASIAAMMLANGRIEII